MRFKKVLAAFMSAVLLLSATGCTAEARNSKAREEMEDSFGSYMDKVLAGKDASKYVDAKNEATFDVTYEQEEILRCVLKNAEYEIEESEAVAKDKEGSITIKLRYADAEEYAGSYFDDELDELLDDLANASKKYYLKKKIKIDLEQVDDTWLVTKKSDAKLKKELQAIVENIYLESYYSIDIKPTGSNSNKVGISLPTKDLQRWNQDGDRMKYDLESRGYEVDLQYASNSVSTQQDQIMSMIDSGCSVLVVAAISPSTLDYELRTAKQQGITVIAYDRLIYDTDAVDYFVSFDNYMVGVIQAQYIVDLLKLDTATTGDRPVNIEITAGDPTDNNAVYFYNGAYDVLVSYINRGLVNIPSGQIDFYDVATPNWSTEQAQARAENIIGKYYSDGTIIDAWLCSNDSTALGVTNAMNAKYVNPYPIITGQDCDIANVKNIINGKQAMSVFKDTGILCDRAVTMVDQILAGEVVQCNDTGTYFNGIKTVPAYLCNAVYVDKFNYKNILIDSGYYTADQLN